MQKLNSNEIVWTTFYTIHKIWEYNNGGNMLLLYFAYIEQSRIQQTNQSWSTDIFMMKKLSWTKEKFYKAKKWLRELWLIDILQIKDKETWKIKTWYVKTNFIINEQKVREHNITYEIEWSISLENQNPEKSDSGKSETNALSIKKKCLKNKTKEKNFFEKLLEQESFSEKLNSLIRDFVENRKQMKKEMTKVALTRLFNKLKQYKEEEAIQMLEESIEKWRQWIFESSIKKTSAPKFDDPLDEFTHYRNNWDINDLKQKYWLEKFFKLKKQRIDTRFISLQK